MINLLEAIETILRDMETNNIRPHSITIGTHTYMRLVEEYKEHIPYTTSKMNMCELKEDMELYFNVKLLFSTHTESLSIG